MAKPANRPDGAGPRRPKRHWGRRLVVIGLVVILLVFGGPLATTWVVSVSRIVTVSTVAPHDVAIVFGAGLDGTKPSAYLAARLQVALDLYQAGKVKVIVVSGDNREVYHNEPAAMLNWLTDRGVPANKIVADYAGNDTYSTCYRAKAIFGVTSAILVSQTYHLPRAIATCRLLGVDVVGVGDTTMKQRFPQLWSSYQLREFPAILNMVWQVVTDRQPVLGPPDDAVQRALGQ